MVKRETGGFISFGLIFLMLSITAPTAHAQSLDSEERTDPYPAQSEEANYWSPSAGDLTFSFDDEFMEIAARNSATTNARSKQRTKSLTVGYIDDEFLFRTDAGSDRFRFEGESAGLMFSGQSASLMLVYGNSEAFESEGDIRSIAADLSFGGNKHLFRNFLQLPVGIYVPIRFNLGYRNLTLIEDEESLHLGQGGVGAGVGASARIPTGIPIVRDNITGFASFVRSVGGLGDLSGSDQAMGNEFGQALSGIRLTQNTDFNIEGKFENLLGDNTGVTLGLTLRWMSWSEEAASNVWEVFDVVSGQRDDLVQRGTQTFLRVGINW